jgi:hypothetical protein
VGFSGFFQLPTHPKNPRVGRCGWVGKWVVGANPAFFPPFPGFSVFSLFFSVFSGFFGFFFSFSGFFRFFRSFQFLRD